MFDFLVKNGMVVDGTGNVGFKADVAIAGDSLKILMGDTSSIEALRVVDARDCIVCPGFIDVHTHSDIVPLAETRTNRSP